MSFPGEAPSSMPVPTPPPAPRDHMAQIEHAVAATAHLDKDDVSGHVARFDAVHGALSDALSSIDSV